MASNDLDVEILKAREANPDANKPKKITPEEAGHQALMQKLYPIQYGAQQREGPQPDPLTQIYRGADQRGRSYQALAAWEEENAAIRYFSPTYYGAMKKELMQQLGIAPY